jgi:hypothetical protein
MKEKKAEKPNNVQWVGKRQKLDKETGKYETVPLPAPRVFRQKGMKIDLPEGIENGAYVEEAETLKAAFPDYFKTPIEKGGKK